MKSTLVVSVALLATTVCAQTTKVIPVNLTSTEGNSSSAYHFGYTHPRSQQIWNGTSITNAVAVLSGLKYRRDARNKTAYTGRSYTRATFRLGTTSVSPASMSTTFARNITTTLTTVFNKAWSLPAQPAPRTAPAPFNIGISWTQPYIFDPRKGNLILDLTIPGTIGKSNYFCDAERMTKGGSGTVIHFGTGGTFSSPEKYRLNGIPNGLAPGGLLDLPAGPFTKAYTGTLILGLSNKTWSGVTLPFGLAAIGAPGNNLYVSMDVLFPYNATASGSSYVSNFKAPIPNNPIYAGVTFYAQAYYADQNANAAGLVASNGLTLTTSKTGAPMMQTVGYYDSSKATGNYIFGANAMGGPVIQFSGVIP